MKILFGIQGTGNGHISRCIPIVQELKNSGHQVDILVSGVSNELQFPFEVKYRKKGLSYIFGRKGGIDLLRTSAKCNVFRMFYEVLRCPVNSYDIVISDFEPITAWACKLKGKKCIGFGNQYAAKYFPIRAKGFQEKLGVFLLHHFAPANVSLKYDYLQNENRNTYLPSLAFKNHQIQESPSGKEILVYLPAHSKKSIIRLAEQFPEFSFTSFSKRVIEAEYPRVNLTFKPIDRNSFLESVFKSNKTITAAGFGLTSELIQLGKDMLVLPMKNQVEQKINASKLNKLGYKVIHSINDVDQIAEWLFHSHPVKPLHHSTIPTITHKLLSLAS